MGQAAVSSSQVDSDFLSVTLAVASERLLESRFTVPQVVANPAAGANVRVNVPGGSVWELLSAKFTFTASGVAGNRIVALTFNDQDGNSFADFTVNTAVIAAGVGQFTFAQGLGYQVNATPFMVGLPTPPIPLVPAWSIRTTTAAIDAGDQFSAVRLLVRQWSEAEIAQECVELVEQYDSFTSRLLGTGVR